MLQPGHQCTKFRPWSKGEHQLGQGGSTKSGHGPSYVWAAAEGFVNKKGRVEDVGDGRQRRKKGIKLRVLTARCIADLCRGIYRKFFRGQVFASGIVMPGWAWVQALGLGLVGLEPRLLSLLQQGQSSELRKFRRAHR